MTLQQLLPLPHLLPICLQPKNTPQHAFLDWWVDYYVEIDTRVKTRLTRGGSLYQAYVDACLEQSLIPLSLRAFTKRFETLLEFKLNIPSTKARDQKGTFFRAIKLKDACHHVTPFTLSSDPSLFHFASKVMREELRSFTESKEVSFSLSLVHFFHFASKVMAK